jgi:hypothetical protein
VAEELFRSLNGDVLVEVLGTVPATDRRSSLG